MTKLCFKKICIFFFLILGLFGYNAFAEIESKGLICKCFKDKDTRFSCYPESPVEAMSPYLGIFFKNENVEAHYLTLWNEGNEKIPVINTSKEPEDYLIEPDFIQWPKKYDLGQYRGKIYFQDGNTFLDRKSLILTNIHRWGHLGNKSTDYIKYDCNSSEQYKNPIIGYDNFKKEMDKFRIKSKEARDKLKKGNKF